MLGNWEFKYLIDAYNENGTRNMKNVSRDQFNCGGYALETYNWVLPCDSEEECEELYDFDMWEYDYDEDDFNESAERGAEWMLENIPNLRRVDSPDVELDKDEWLIGFKVGAGSGDGDFHYIKRTPSGQFWHKPGGSYVRRMGKKEALSDDWGNGRYTSKTIWLARKK